MGNELTQGMAGFEELEDDIAIFLGGKEELEFEDFAKLLHKAESGGAGRTLTALLESTDEGMRLVDAVRHHDEARQQETARNAVVTIQSLPPLAQEIWNDSMPSDGVADVEHVQMALFTHQNDMHLDIGDDDLMLLISNMTNAAQDSSNIELNYFWKILKPV